MQLLMLRNWLTNYPQNWEKKDDKYLATPEFLVLWSESVSLLASENEITLKQGRNQGVLRGLRLPLP